MILRPGVRERVLQEIAAVCPEVRREEGCLDYCAAVDVQSGLARQQPLRADVVTIIERWRDLEALAAHSAAPHVQELRKRIADSVLYSSMYVLAPTNPES